MEIKNGTVDDTAMAWKAVDYANSGHYNATQQSSNKRKKLIFRPLPTVTRPTNVSYRFYSTNVDSAIMMMCRHIYFSRLPKDTPHDWEHIPSRYFYIKLVKSVLYNISSGYSNLSIKNVYNQIFSKYRSITGANCNPPFYSFDKERKCYIQMSDE